MPFQKQKFVNLMILVLSLTLIVTAAVGSYFAISYMNMHDGYYWLIDNSLMKTFMAFTGISFSLSLVSSFYSLYVCDHLAQFYHILSRRHSKLFKAKKAKAKVEDNNEEQEHMSTFLAKIFTGIVIVTCIGVISLGLFDLTTIDTLFSSRGILKSLQVYKSNLEVKACIDRLQMEYKCCGHLAFTNWTDENVIMEPGPEDIQGEIIRYIPFSCCNSSSMRPCVHELVNVDQVAMDYIFPRDLSIYTTGCSIVMKSSFETVLRGIVYSSIGIACIEILVMVCYYII